MRILKIIDRPNKFLSNIFLLIALFFLIFIIPVFPRSSHTLLIDVFYSVMYIFGIYALDKVRKGVLIVALFAFVTQWLARIFNIPTFTFVSELTNIVFLQVIIIRLIIQIARSKKVDANVIFESINGYLFMGLFYAIWMALLFHNNPESLSGIDPENYTFHDILYFTYVTITTLGYGDITPQVPLAKSLAILISASGQLYVAVIIAMLVGKFASKSE